MTRDFYDILGVSRGATAELIRAAHRVQSRRFHPDTADDGKGDAREFAQIQEAYETLSNADAKRRYDARKGFERGETSAPGPRRPPKAPCGACGKPVYASQLQLFLGRRMCRACVEQRRLREQQRPRLTSMTEAGWRFRQYLVFAQSHMALIVVVLLAMAAVGARLATVGGHPHRVDRAATSNTPSAAAPNPLEPGDPRRVPSAPVTESADAQPARDPVTP